MIIIGSDNVLNHAHAANKTNQVRTHMPLHNCVTVTYTITRAENKKALFIFIIRATERRRLGLPTNKTFKRFVSSEI
jgi:hypothetical protein